MSRKHLLATLTAVVVMAGTSPFAQAQTVEPTLAATENAFTHIVEKTGPAVVNIDVQSTVTKRIGPALPDDPFFREFFGDLFKEYTRQIPMRGTGSGFVVSSDGQILTNNHVVADADKITVTFSDGRSLDATVVGRDPTFDLAVLKVEGKDLPTLPLGDSDSAKVGSWVIAIGNPLGLGVEPTVTVGVLSAKNRSIHARDFNFDGFLQTDAAINPGNSGGPLLDINGKVVGINTAIAPMAQGIGFAIPVNMAKQVMNDIVTHGQVRRGMMGVYLQPLTKEIVDGLGLKDNKGSLVADVKEDSPAKKAGIQPGDVILSVDGKAVENPVELGKMVRSRMAGDSIKIEAIRKGVIKSFRVALDPVDEETGTAQNSKSSDVLGLSVTPLNEQQRKKMNLKDSVKGLLIVDIKEKSPAATAGLRENDVILEAGNKVVTSASDLNKAVKDAENKNNTLALLILRGDRSQFVTIKTK